MAHTFEFVIYFVRHGVSVTKPDYYRHPCVATEPIIFYLTVFFLFTVRSQKLLNRFSPNF